MKKFISVVLSFVMIFTVTVPAFAADTADEAVTIIYLRGNGQKIYNAEGEEVVCDIGDLKFDTEGEDGTGKIVESIVNILLPFLIEGIGSDNKGL